MKIEDYEYYANLITYNTNWCTNNNKILILHDREDNYTTAHSLSYYSDENNWLTDNINILTLYFSPNIRVVDNLNIQHIHWTTSTLDILKIKGKI